MELVRMYSGEDGETHFEDLAFSFEATERDDGLAGNMWEFVEVVGVQGARLQMNTGEMDRGYHTAPRRQLVIYITGSRQMISGNGETRIAGPGVILLAEDTTGRGHRTISLSDPQQFVLIYLDPDMSVEEIFSRAGGVERDQMKPPAR